MSREPVEINKASAIWIAKHFVGVEAASEKDFLRKIAMSQAVSEGGAIDQIANLLYGMGIKLSVDKSNPEHANWLAIGAAKADK